MYAYAAQISQQEKVISGAFAFGMHLLFLALLIFGVTWQKKVEPQANIVDLWASLPSPTKPQAEPPPPEPVVRPEAKPVEPPPVKAMAKPEVAKPDIALKEKAEKERRILEEKQKQAKRREEEAKAAQKQQQAKQAEAQRLAREQEDAENKMIEEYRAKIQAGIYQKMQPFDDLPKDTYADVEITVLPDGRVFATNVKKNSASARFNAAVELAILRAQPLPVPKDPALFSSHFRRLDLTFRPKQ